MKKALGETQTLRAGCSKAKPNISTLAADPLPGGAGRPSCKLPIFVGIRGNVTHFSELGGNTTHFQNELKETSGTTTRLPAPLSSRYHKFRGSTAQY